MQVMDDMKFLQQQRNIEIVRLIDNEYVFGQDMWYGWFPPSAKDLQMMPQVRIDALPTLEPYSFSWSQGASDYWNLTHYQGKNKFTFHGAIKPGHHVHELYDRRLDWGQEWGGDYSLTVCDVKHPPNYYNLISPVLSHWWASQPAYPPQQLPMYQFHNDFSQEWHVSLLWLPPNSHLEYFGNPIPEMYWCVNVEGLADEHWIQLQYKLDLGFAFFFFFIH